MKLTVVTASTDPIRAASCILTWNDQPTIIVVNGRDYWVSEQAEQTEIQATWLTEPAYLGSVSAFRRGVDWALEHTEADIIACLHDDFEIHDQDWATKVLRHFARHPACGLLGFGGALGLGDEDLYQKPYNPMSLARKHFRSNLVDAEAHGIRSLLPERVACLDGFSQIGRRGFWFGRQYVTDGKDRTGFTEQPNCVRQWTLLEDLGIRHHCYDSILGAIAKRYDWEVWYLPVAGKHHGGRTAVGDAGYQEWAKGQMPGGDQGFWEFAHKVCYQEFKDVLPIRI